MVGGVDLLGRNEVMDSAEPADGHVRKQASQDSSSGLFLLARQLALAQEHVALTKPRPVGPILAKRSHHRRDTRRTVPHPNGLRQGGVEHLDAMPHLARTNARRNSGPLRPTTASCNRPANPASSALSSPGTDAGSKSARLSNRSGWASANANATNPPPE